MHFYIKINNNIVKACKLATFVLTIFALLILHRKNLLFAIGNVLLKLINLAQWLFGFNIMLFCRSLYSAKCNSLGK